MFLSDELVITPYFLTSLIEVEALGLPIDSKMWLLRTRDNCGVKNDNCDVNNDVNNYSHDA